MDKTTNAVKSPANERKAWIKPEVVDVDGSAEGIEASAGPASEGFASSSS